jgi:hypothetical protein
VSGFFQRQLKLIDEVLSSVRLLLKAASESASAEERAKNISKTGVSED